jgi:glycine cleavage system aminomethyltransferase T
MNPPTRLTALYHKHLALKAAMAEYEGWLLPERYAGPEEEIDAALGSVGLSDCSATVKVDVKGEGSEIDGFLGEILDGGKIAGRPGQVTVHPTGDPGSVRYVCRLAVDHALLVLRARRVSPRISPLEPEVGGAHGRRVYLTDTTSALAGITLVGPEAPHVLSKLSSLDVSLSALPDPGCTEGGLAGVQCALVRSGVAIRGRRVPVFDLYFARSYAEYLWDALGVAGSEFRIAPIGTRACGWLLADPSTAGGGAGREEG